MPSALLQRRPDVARAERAMAAANAQIGVARAAWFPVFSLTGEAGFRASRRRTWFKAPSRIWSVGPAATVPLLDFGARSAVNQQARAAYDEAVANYRKTTLTAYQEVEDNLAALHHLADEVAADQAASKSAESAANHSDKRYDAGVADYVEVTTTHTAALQEERDAISARVLQLNAAVALVRATGGGWTSERIEQVMNTISEGVLKRTCMRDRIRDVLVGRILDGTYAAGTQLKELSLAREFNVSQTPIREALRELEGLGSRDERALPGHARARRRFRRNARVVRVAHDVGDALGEVGGALPEALLADFEEYVVEMDAAVKENDSERYIDAALRFHRRMVEGSRNRTFLSVWDSLLWDIRGRIALRRLTEKGHSLDSLASSHRELLSVCVPRTPKRAADAGSSSFSSACRSAFDPA